MKTSYWLFQALIVLSFMICLLACQKQELGVKQSLTGDDPVVIRTDDCDPCDGMSECCCAVELLEDDAALIHICGTSDGAGACSGSMENCNGAQSGGGQVISLNSTTNPKQVFCMLEGSTIRITNLSSTDAAGIRVGCNTVSVTAIDYNISPQDSVKANTNASCELEDCT